MKSNHSSITRIAGVAERKLLTAKVAKVSQRAQKTIPVETANHFFTQTEIPSRKGRMVVNTSLDPYISLFSSRIALVLASGLGLATLPLHRTLSVMNSPPLLRWEIAIRNTRG